MHTPSPSVRTLHRHLALGAWPGAGMSPMNTLLCAITFASCLFVILSTEPALSPMLSGGIFYAQWVCVGIFAVEYIARLVAVGGNPIYAGLRGRARYARTPFALLDFFAVAPVFWLGLEGTVFFFLRTGRLAVFFSYGRFAPAWHALSQAVRERSYELVLAVLLGLAALTIAATLMYHVEGAAQPEAFGSIPRALWWSLVTLTTVGYGDVTPITMPGRIVAGFAALIAVGIVAMPAGILAAALSDAAHKRRARTKKKKPKAD